MSIIKKDAQKLIEKLPDKVTWDDLIYEFYVKKKIAVALQAARAGRIVTHAEVKKRFISK
jgi:predicted transcriptional regulator